jgi:hypothetical protein
VDQEVACFNQFADRSQKASTTTRIAEAINIRAGGAKAPDKPDRNKKPKSDKVLNLVKLIGRRELEDAPIEDAGDIFDISEEIRLLREVKDIRDELNILRNLFGQQKRVVESYCLLTRPKLERSHFLDGIQSHVDAVEVMDEDAKKQYKSVSECPSC